MKRIVIGLMLLVGMINATQINTRKQVYHENETITVNYKDMYGGKEDWIGIYPKEASNEWKNMQQWNWTSGKSIGKINFNINDLNNGNYEVRAFFNNSFDTEAIYSFSVEKKLPDIPKKDGYIYGKMGNIPIEVENVKFEGIENDDIDIYHPTNWNKETPILFFIPQGNRGRDDKVFASMFNFMATHGYTVAFLPRPLGRQTNEAIKLIMTKYSENIDETKVGVMGWSNGGGATFEVLKFMIAEGYGEQGRLLLSFDGSFPQYISKSDLNNFINTNIILMQFGKYGNGQTPAIQIATYNFLTGEGVDKNYIVLANRGHHHVTNKIENMQDLVKPLEALIEYTFSKDPTYKEEHRQNSLEGAGKEKPLDLGKDIIDIRPYSKYSWRCVEVARDYEDSRVNPTKSTESDYYLELFKIYNDACDEERIRLGY